MEFKKDIDFEVFEQLDIRVGTITKCEKHPDADRLLVFQVDFKDFQRQILSSIAMHYPNCEALVGKQVVAILNLKPRKLRGLLSHGMLLCAENEEDTMLSLISTLEKVEDGLFVA
ncbi:hypothetical protein EII25_01310 [Erysipelotrichaceae bacterium OH741_COT-311]|nr:hypothetical protein EII25_01310 [Erysipelotrichaceae bacterium OH741_COT-311]